MRVVYKIFAVITLSSCSAQQNSISSCSKTLAVSLPGSGVHEDLRSGRLPPAWGGVLDLIEDPSKPESSLRHRCTVHMDLVISNSSSEVNPSEVAFWTADHCLKFAEAQDAELYLFDPDKKVYLRMKISIPEFERFKQGVELFRNRARAEGALSALAEEDLNSFIEAGKRKSVLHNGAPLIERGTDFCKIDTAAFKSAQPGQTATCSTVLDLARLSAFIAPESLQRPEVVDALQRLKTHLKKMDENRLALVDKVEGEADKIGYRFMVSHWRTKVTALTLWRRYEAESKLIEKVRQCASTDFSGICASPFRVLFAGALLDYTAWNQPSNDFPTALRNEVYAEPLPNNETKHNLKWLLSSQNGLGRSMERSPALLAEVKFSSNFSRKRELLQSSTELPVLGTSGGLYYGHASPFTIYTTKPNAVPIQINPKTILITHTTMQDGGMNFFLQPGDSGSLWLVGGLPLGVVATVDGKETSGGTSLMPLPTNTEEEDEGVNLPSARTNASKSGSFCK